MDLSATLRRDALLKAIEEAKALVASNNLDHHEAMEPIEFPEGVKPAPLAVEL